MANEEISVNSVVTKARKIAFCKITSGAINTIPKITQMVLGDGGVGSDGEPVPPLETETKLKHEVGRYPIDNGKPEYIGDTTAQYTVTIPKDELGGVKINELALADANGTLYVIQTMYPKQKDKGGTMVFWLNDVF